ncbi:hypothetical protein SDJN03_21921, partial [Cucurbita argyrosperma subsp. sororia]
MDQLMFSRCRNCVITFYIRIIFRHSSIGAFKRKGNRNKGKIFPGRFILSDVLVARGFFRRRKLLVSVHLDWWLVEILSVDLNGDEEHAGAVAACALT